MRYFWLLPALVLDITQFFAGLAFIAMQFATPVGLGASTALGAAYYCWNTSTGILSGIANAAACAAGGGIVGAGVSAFAIPLGIALDVALSVSIGGALILGLAVSGMFYPNIIMSRFVGEMMPLLNFLPIWSNMVWKCIQRKKQEEESAPAVAMEQQIQDKEPERSRAPLLPGRFSDIKPAIRGAALVLMLAFGIHASAQTMPAPIQYVVTPETPGARETVRIEAQGVGSFLGDADITWTQNGAVVKAGTGERWYTFVTGALGEKTVIKVSIDSSQGFFTQTFTFNPARINLVWEADTTTPPLYRGKALYSGGSSYKVVAFPTVYSGSSRISPGALSYQWFYRGDVVPEASGLGRSVLTRTGDQLQNGEDIAVEVYYGTTKVGRATLFIPAVDPELVLYQRDALRGVLYEQALPAGISLIGKEITLQAEPFYFSTATKKSGLIPFVWTLNDAETAGPDSSRGILTLRQTGSGTGDATLGVSMQNNNPDQFIQAANTSIRIEFGAQQGGILNFLGI